MQYGNILHIAKTSKFCKIHVKFRHTKKHLRKIGKLPAVNVHKTNLLYNFAVFFAMFYLLYKSNICINLRWSQGIIYLQSKIFLLGLTKISISSGKIFLLGFTSSGSNKVITDIDLLMAGRKQGIHF